MPECQPHLLSQNLDDSWFPSYVFCWVLVWNQTQSVRRALLVYIVTVSLGILFSLKS